MFYIGSEYIAFLEGQANTHAIFWMNFIMKNIGMRTPLYHLLLLFLLYMLGFMFYGNSVLSPKSAINV